MRATSDEWAAQDQLRLPLPPVPGLYREQAEWVRAINARAVRIAAGISLETIAEALEVSVPSIWRWERGRNAPRREQGGRGYGRYCRVIAGLARHLEVNATERKAG